MRPGRGMGGDMHVRDSQSHKRRILVVDDDDNVRRLVNLVLGRHGYEVETAANGTAGLEALTRSAPDLVLLDMTMPDMDGLAFLEVKARIEATANVPVIVLSARNRNADVVAAITQGASNYIAKPFQPELLAEHVARCLPPETDTGAAPDRAVG